jgi:ubiquinone biosynthesis protein
MKPLNFLANAVRAPEIVAILVRWGFEDLLLQVDTPQFLLRNLVRKKVAHLSTFERMRNACEELGPIFVKFGQILSTRPDRLPEPLVNELKRLRSHVEAQEFERIEPVLLKELGFPVDEVFEAFDREPKAAGSLGQVYKARLPGAGPDQFVSVKVQRADIQKTISADLEIIGWFARQLHQRVEALRPYNLPELVQQAEERLKQELDFRLEAQNAEIFRALNGNKERVFAPKVYEHLSTRRVLVTEWVNGAPADEVKLAPEVAQELAKIGGASVFEQIVVSGFFHADPHSGNILITDDHRICFLDWGQAGQITRDMRYDLADLLAGVLARDTEKVVRVAERMSLGNRRIDRPKIEKAVTLIINRHRAKSKTDADIGIVGLELLYAFGINGIEIPSDYALLAKAIVCVEESGKTLDPDFDIHGCSRPFLEKLRRERIAPKNVVRNAFWPLYQAVQRIQRLPGDIHRILRRIEDEDISINLHHTGTEELEDTFNAAMNRLTVGIILGSLIIGSSLVITTGVQPLLWGFPAIGILGFLFSGLLGIYIVISSLRGHHYNKKGGSNKSNRP